MSKSMEEKIGAAMEAIQRQRDADRNLTAELNLALYQDRARIQGLYEVIERSSGEIRISTLCRHVCDCTVKDGDIIVIADEMKSPKTFTKVEQATDAIAVLIAQVRTAPEPLSPLVGFVGGGSR